MTKRQRNSFLTPLVVEVMPNGKTFKIAREFTYRWLRQGVTIHIGSGFVTDFASIPRFARVIIPKLGRYTKASVVHDYLYQQPPSFYTRRYADLCFRDAMEEMGVVAWKRWAMWLAVRLGGWAAWRKR